MEINANIIQKVQINPQDVIKKLIEKEIGFDSWVIKKGDKFLMCTEKNAGYETEKEIEEDKYNYIKALQLVLKNLKEV